MQPLIVFTFAGLIEARKHRECVLSARSRHRPKPQQNVAMGGNRTYKSEISTEDAHAGLEVVLDNMACRRRAAAYADRQDPAARARLRASRQPVTLSA